MDSRDNGARVARINRANSKDATIGAFVWNTTNQERIRVPRTTLKQSLASAGFPADYLVGEDPSPDGCLGRAKGSWRGGKRTSYELARPELGARGEVVIVRWDGARLDKEGRIAALVEFDDHANLRCVQGPAWDQAAGDIFAELQDAYNEHMHMANANELRMVLTRAITDWFGGCRVRSEGHIYWVPPSSTNDMSRLAQVLSEIGYYTFVAPIADTSSGRAGVSHGIAASFTEDAQRVLERLRAARDGGKTLRESTVSARLDDLLHLRQLADGYADILETKHKEVLAEIAAAEDFCRDLLGEAGPDPF